MNFPLFVHRLPVGVPVAIGDWLSTYTVHERSAGVCPSASLTRTAIACAPSSSFAGSHVYEWLMVFAQPDAGSHTAPPALVFERVSRVRQARSENEKLSNPTVAEAGMFCHAPTAISPATCGPSVESLAQTVHVAGGTVPTFHAFA